MKKKTMKSPWGKVKSRLAGNLRPKPLMGRPKTKTPIFSSGRGKNLNPVSYATLQRVFSAGSRSAKPFARKLPRLRKKVRSYGTAARR